MWEMDAQPTKAIAETVDSRLGTLTKISLARLGWVWRAIALIKVDERRMI